MIKNNESLEKQKEEIISQLNGGFSIGPLKKVAPRTNLKEICDFIEISWKDTYGNRERFEYGLEYLDWVYGSSLESNMNIGAKEGSQLAGIFLYTPRKILIGGNIIDTGIQSALSIKPDQKGRGLAKLVHLEAQKQAIDTKDGTFFWYDSTDSGPKVSHEIFKKLEEKYFNSWGRFVLRANVIDLPRAIESTILKGYEILGMKAINKFESLLPYEKVSIEPIKETNVDEARKFVNKKAIEYEYGRIFEEAEFRRYAQFMDSQNNPFSFGIVLKKDCNIKGVGIGYPLNVVGKNKDNIFLLDYLLFDKSVNSHEKRGFLKEYKRLISEIFNPFGIITPYKIGMADGYFPSKDSLSCYSIGFNQSMQQNKRKFNLVIDHK